MPPKCEVLLVERIGYGLVVRNPMTNALLVGKEPRSPCRSNLRRIALLPAIIAS